MKFFQLFVRIFTIIPLKRLAYNACKWLLASLRIQLGLFLVALPILTSWGLPLSAASIIGNLLFAPWAAAFLGFSTLWLMTHLCGAPTFPIIYCLEQITQCWLWCLSWGSPHMLFAVPTAHPLILVCIPLSAYILLYSPVRLRCGLHKEVMALSLLTVGWCWGLCRYAKATTPIPITQSGKILWLCPTKRGITLIDNQGALRNLSESSPWITFCLAPTLARQFGACRCHDIIIIKPTVARLAAAATIIRAGKGITLIIPEWVMHKKWWLKWRKENNDIPAKGYEEKGLIAMCASLRDHIDQPSL
jgi:hypothetical protein